MTKVILPGPPPIELSLRPSARARRLSLRVSRLDGRITLTLPKGVRRTEALAFAREKESWLRRHLAGRPEEVVIALGAQIPFDGQMRAIVAADIRAPHLRGDVIELPARNPDKTAMRLQAFLKLCARERLQRASERYADALGRRFGRITLRDTRSRWGSCSHEGNLMYSWRLIMAPPEVLDYVAAHEVAHLVEMNHSKAYWDVVAGICPEHARHRAWLRDHGPGLHRYRFGD